jgi:uncharacterized protein
MLQSMYMFQESSNGPSTFFWFLPLYLFISVILYIIYLKKNSLKSFILKLSINIIFIASILILSIGLYSYAYHRFDLQVDTHIIKTGSKAKFAVITDPHLGKFKDQKFLKVVVDRINSIPDLDAVLIAGDFTYWPVIDNMHELFAPFKDIKVKTYAVLGNHDVQKPGPKLDVELVQALTDNNVILIDGKIETIKLKTGNDYKLVGLMDYWLESYNINNIKELQSKDQDNNYLILVHQPDVVRGYNDLTRTPPLTVAGHTHCGQVRIPGMYNSHLPTFNHYFDKGFYEAKGSFGQMLNSESSNDPKLFISCGVGEVGLPLRLNNPPVIDVLELVE